MSKTKRHFDVVVVGGGLVGLTASLCLTMANYKVALCAPVHSHKDPRTTALLDYSVQFLSRSGLWKQLEDYAHPLKTMRLVDGTSRLLRFHQTDFNAGEIDLEAFGYNLANAKLLSVLEDELAKQDGCSRIDGVVGSIERDKDGTIELNIDGSGEFAGKVSTGFLVGADGFNSIVRQFFGFGQREWSYPQSAIVVDFDHEYSSQYVSTEFHTETGPFTIVPQTHKTAGLVWLEEPARAQEIIALPPARLNELLEEKMHSWLGRIITKNEPKAFSMKGMTAKRFGDGNHALVGEAAHVFPPIGAQGFNLGIRDIEAVGDVMTRFTKHENRGQQYHNLRVSDINSRSAGVDLLNRSLLSSFLPVQAMKTAGMFAFSTVPPLRKQAMKLGLKPLRFG